MSVETVTAATPSLTTSAGGTIVLGSGTGKLTDSVTISGGFNPTGTLTFTLLGPGNIVLDTETSPVNGNTTYNTPTGFVPTALGGSQWEVTYSGDSNNNPVSATSLSTTSSMLAVATKYLPTAE